MYLCRLSDSSSRILQFYSLPIICVWTKVISMCVLALPRTNVGEFSLYSMHLVSSTELPQLPDSKLKLSAVMTDKSEPLILPSKRVRELFHVRAGSRCPITAVYPKTFDFYLRVYKACLWIARALNWNVSLHKNSCMPS